MPEAAELFGRDAATLDATLLADRWELAAARRRPGGVTVDRRWRVRVPAGVRHRLGLDAGVVVSLARDATRVVVWPVARLDELVGR